MVDSTDEFLRQLNTGRHVGDVRFIDKSERLVNRSLKRKPGPKGLYSRFKTRPCIRFQWHLADSYNKRALSVLQDKLGELLDLPDEYVALVKNQKSELDSGVNTPRNGFHFLFRANWDEHTEKLSDLVISVFNGHDIAVSRIALKDASDYGDELVSQTRRARRGQRKLKLNLLKLYKCIPGGIRISDAKKTM